MMQPSSCTFSYCALTFFSLSVDFQLPSLSHLKVSLFPFIALTDAFPFVKRVSISALGFFALS